MTDRVLSIRENRKLPSLSENRLITAQKVLDVCQLSVRYGIGLKLNNWDVGILIKKTLIEIF